MAGAAVVNGVWWMNNEVENLLSCFIFTAVSFFLENWLGLSPKKNWALYIIRISYFPKSLQMHSLLQLFTT